MYCGVIMTLMQVLGVGVSTYCILIKLSQPITVTIKDLKDTEVSTLDDSRPHYNPYNHVTKYASCQSSSVIPLADFQND